MTDYPPWLSLLGVTVVVGAPLSLTVLLGASTLIGRKFSEATTTRLVQWSISTGLLASIAVLASMLATGTRHLAIDLGNWVSVGHSYHFSIKFVFDRLS